MRSSGGRVDERADFLAWMAAVSAPEVGERIAADEAAFLDRSKMRPYVVEDAGAAG